MKNNRHKPIRQMIVRQTPKAREASIKVRCARQWYVDHQRRPCQDDMTAARAVLQRLEALADERDRAAAKSLGVTRLELRRRRAS